ncbi:TetR/AcrR family transcriptional regulator [Agromyces bauzanensis]
MKTTTRTYTMRARAEQAEQTRDRILDAVVGLSAERPLAACTLPAIADRAGVSVQTVLRAFGSRDGLLEAALERTSAEVVAERPADPADRRGTITALVDHYESRGDAVLLLLAQEAWEPFAARITENGKRLHRQWVQAAFADVLGGLSGTARTEAVDLLVAATDLSAWKIWRRDLGRSRGETLERMLRLATSVTEHLRREAR